MTAGRLWRQPDVLSADTHRAAGVPGGLRTPGTASGLATHTYAFEPVRIPEEHGVPGTKVGDELVGRPTAISRRRISSKASMDAAFSPT
ncbi:MAG TPA: hypothetical protein VEF72_16555 [Mycobacterium sp.]|nr:hypothetical protein [Mycobacterium sp.]